MRHRLRTLLATALLVAPLQCHAIPGGEPMMKVTRSGYLAAPGVSSCSTCCLTKKCYPIASSGVVRNFSRSSVSDQIHLGTRATAKPLRSLPGSQAG